MTHTPGPWEAFEVLSGAYHWRWGVRIGTESAWRLCEGLPEADAHLIASAPGLLAALEQVVALAQGVVVREPGLLAECRAAIAKAKGIEA